MKHDQLKNILSEVYSTRYNILTQINYLDKISILFHKALISFGPDDIEVPKVHSSINDDGLISFEWIFENCRIGFFIDTLANLEESSWSVIFIPPDAKMQVYSGWFKDIDEQKMIELIREVAETGLKIGKEND